MARHEFEKCQAAKQRKDNRAEETFPGFFRADVRNHQMPPNHAAGQIRAHVREFGDRDQVQHIKLSGELAGAQARRQIHDLGDEIKKPKHIKQAEQGVSHRLQRLVIAQARKHLSSKNCK